jgi:hypothetical protein
LIAVPISVFAKSSGKIAQFCFDRIKREKHTAIKLMNSIKNWALVLFVNLQEIKEKVPVSGIFLKFKIVVCFCHDSGNFWISTSGDASSGPGNTAQY